MKAIPIATAPVGTTQIRCRSNRAHSAQHWLRRLLAGLRRWHHRHRSRAALATLDARALRDIGITSADAWHEINKPFWRS